MRAKNSASGWLFKFSKPVFLPPFFRPEPEKWVAEGADITTGKTIGSEKDFRGTTQKTTQKIIEILRNNPKAGRKEISQTIGNMMEDGVKYNTV